MKHIKLILLDFDGTLVDTRHANGHAYIEALSHAGIDISYEEYLDRYFGVRCMEFMRMVGIEDEDEIARIRQLKINIYPKYFDSVTLNTPLWEWCQMMRRMGSQVWIVSTGHRDNIRNVMNHLNITSGIDGIITGDDVCNPKPAPDCFIMAMNRVGVSAQETIIFEDSAVGLQAAEASGANFFKITL